MIKLTLQALNCILSSSRLDVSRQCTSDRKTPKIIRAETSGANISYSMELVDEDIEAILRALKLVRDTRRTPLTQTCSTGKQFEPSCFVNGETPPTLCLG